jgi:pyroglutamyl-peptidase
MSTTVLITGFGPFPGAPFNPTEILAGELTRRRLSPSSNVYRMSHVFRVSYEAVDRDLPELIAGMRPDVLVMFGLAGRTKHVRIETRARNALARTTPDAAGRLPAASTIAAGEPAMLHLRAPMQRLLMAARSAGLPAALSHDAGRYLCNYLCWRAAESAQRGTPRIAAFIHVPQIHREHLHRPRRARLTFDNLLAAGEAIVRAAISSARSFS